MTNIGLQNGTNGEFLAPGEYSYDNSPHRHGKHTGYRWDAIKKDGQHLWGLSSTRDGALESCLIIIQSDEA